MAGVGSASPGGHTHANWGDPNQRRIFLNGLLWLAKVDVPAKGVTDHITAEDLTQNLDVKGGAPVGDAELSATGTASTPA